jgi:hypothetical protein
MSIEWRDPTLEKDKIPEDQEGLNPEMIENRKKRLRERRKKDLYEILADDALEALETREGYQQKDQSQYDFEFYFKKAWDDFTAPLFIYDDMKRDIEARRQDIEGAFQRGAISNAKRKQALKEVEDELRNLEERKRESEEIIAKTVPEGFNEKTEKQKKAWLDKLYEAYVNRRAKKMRSK